MLYGSDLLQAGWDTSPVPSAKGGTGTVEQELEHTYRNVAAFDRALDAMDRFISPRCCGC
jgi:hypothetical protein